jgi:hypothetical protein
MGDPVIAPNISRMAARLTSIPGRPGKGPCESYLDMSRQVIYAIKFKCNWRNGNKIFTVDF